MRTTFAAVMDATNVSSAEKIRSAPADFRDSHASNKMRPSRYRFGTASGVKMVGL